MSDLHISIDISLILPKEILRLAEFYAGGAKNPVPVMQVKKTCESKAEINMADESDSVYPCLGLDAVSNAVEQTEESKAEDNMTDGLGSDYPRFGVNTVGDLIKKALQAGFGSQVRTLLAPHGNMVPTDYASLKELGARLEEMLK